MRRLLASVALLGILYISNAAYSIYNFISALQTADHATISTHVDFPAVRASLKEQITFALMTNAGSKGDKLSAGLVAAFGPTIIGNFIDTLVTPSGIAKLLENRDPTSPARTGSPQQLDLRRFLESLSITGPTEFRVQAPEGSSVTATFKDWTWKITDLRLPRDALAKMKP